ncbi:MAG: hypothetical protein IKO52_08265 [Clostridia bacterium]|nr:hypothetical protein [Clostridia bacterium]
MKNIAEKEKELEARERALREREQALEKRERELGPFSQAVKTKKEEWYDKVKLSVRQMDVIIWIIYGLLAVVILLIVLEAAGIFKLF